MARAAAAALILLLLAAPAWGQVDSTSRPPAGGAPGIGVDSHGGGVVDPTKNVLDLVLAAVKRLDDLAAEWTRRQDDLRDRESRYQSAMRDGETRRIDQLAAQKQAFDFELARILKANSDSASLLLATQLAEVKRDLSERTAKLEQFRWESGGQNSGRGDAWALMVVAGTFLLLLAGAVIALVTLLKQRQQPAKGEG
jgi:hypothetical protein